MSKNRFNSVYFWLINATHFDEYSEEIVTMTCFALMGQRFLVSKLPTLYPSGALEK
jgi:hypothetical protein